MEFKYLIIEINIEIQNIEIQDIEIRDIEIQNIEIQKLSKIICSLVFVKEKLI